MKRRHAEACPTKDECRSFKLIKGRKSMKVSNFAKLALASSIVLSAACVLAGSPASGYKLINTVTYSAAPGLGATREYFDYVIPEPSARRMYFTHGTEVDVVNADTGEKIGSVTGDWKRVHGVALVPELNKGFITDGDSGTVIVFDLKTLKPTKTIKAEDDADWILYDNASKMIFAFNGSSHTATAIDPVKEEVVKSIPLGGAPEQAYADGKGMIYDTLQSTNEIVAIDTKELVVKSRFPVAPAGAPTSITMDRKTRRLFIGGRNPKMLIVMDADTGKVIGEPFPIGDRVDANVFDPATNMLAAATREGTLHIFHEDSPNKLSVVETIKTQFGAKTMGLDPKTHKLFLTTSDFGPAPAPTEKQPNPQPVATPGTFRLLIYGK
jgi:DNA-binding beta-propeller fold protein YncE